MTTTRCRQDFQLQRSLPTHTRGTKRDSAEGVRCCWNLFSRLFAPLLLLFPFIHLLVDEGVELNGEKKKTKNSLAEVERNDGNLVPVPREWTDRQFRSKQPTPTSCRDNIFFFLVFNGEKEENLIRSSSKLSAGVFLFSIVEKSFPEIGITLRREPVRFNVASRWPMLWFHAVIDRFSPLQKK